MIAGMDHRDRLLTVAELADYLGVNRSGMTGGSFL